MQLPIQGFGKHFIHYVQAIPLINLNVEITFNNRKVKAILMNIMLT